jgi:hypothetical protein
MICTNDIDVASFDRATGDELVTPTLRQLSLFVVACPVLAQVA